MSPFRRAAPAGSWTATALGLAGIALWATETILVTFTAGLPTFEVVGLSFAAAALLSPLAWWLTGTSPRAAFGQPAAVWLVSVPALVAYHACIYFAVRRVPAAPAALLQGCTPLFIVLGTAMLPGGRVRWWHGVAVVAGFEGLFGLAAEGGGLDAMLDGPGPLLVLVGAAAGLWGVYSLFSSRLGDVPTGAMGAFHAVSAVVALACHVAFESWVTPVPTQAAAIAALGLLPMGLALYCWDHGLKKGDVQALGALSHVEPLIGAGLVVAVGQGALNWSMLVSGVVLVGGAVLGSANLFGDNAPPSGSAAPAPAARDDGLVRIARRNQDLLDGIATRCAEMSGMNRALLTRYGRGGTPGSDGSARREEAALLEIATRLQAIAAEL